ncbi:tetratricopeptide repeat protein [Actibacterium sp. XHP0104]|uniref:tetratricopeptide repeat protein n=1 Tax=Actibacterium sp. XHP0104 TaxID=2984335 RepID=UPI0021E6EEE2|nr:tetratricopeptide repeat protein [Actibacterium sp. XHP0104]MCV2880509.1 tetratricopeptide repeat protein [Actibacterium sp. XHP0104]
MRHLTLISLCVGTALTVAGCATKQSQEDVERAIQDVIASDENSMNELMLAVADPSEAVAYFRSAHASQPERIDFQRGLGRALVRAKQYTEASATWGRVIEHPEATNDDRVEYADALIRAGNWDKAETVLDNTPPTYETYRRYRLEAMVADANKEWKKADSFYEIAIGLTTKPSGVLNNWGYSKLSRGDYKEAERLFIEAITYDDTLFTAKNNLILARGAQRNYQMPVIEVSQTERAQLLYTMALTAIKQGDVAIGQGLLEDAIDTHPQHFEAAARALKALESNIGN